MQQLNDIAREIHANAVAHGFYENGLCVADRIACLHEEVAELQECVVNGKADEPCDKPIALTCYQEELADIAIRSLDLLAARGADIDTEFSWVIDTADIFAIRETRGDVLNGAISQSWREYRKGKDFDGDMVRVLELCFKIADLEYFDLFELIRIKHGYNASRPYLHGDAQAPGAVS